MWDIKILTNSKISTFSSSHIHTELHYTTVDHSDFAVQKHTKKNQVKCGILRYLQTRKYIQL